MSIADEGVIEHVLCKEDEDCEVCEEEEKEWKEWKECWNAASSEVKRLKIALRSLDWCEKIEINDDADENAVYICIKDVNIDNKDVDEKSVKSVEVVKILFFNWSADIVFMFISEMCSVASLLNMIVNHVLMTVKSRTSWMLLWGRQ